MRTTIAILLLSVLTALPQGVELRSLEVLGGVEMGGVAEAAGAGCATLRISSSNASDSYNFIGDSPANLYVGQRFTNAADFTPCKIVVQLTNEASPVMTLYASIFNCDGAYPTTLNGSESAGFDCTGLTVKTNVAFTITGASLTNGSIYYAVIRSSASHAANFMRWLRYDTAGGIASNIVVSADGATWGFGADGRASIYWIYSE